MAREPGTRSSLRRDLGTLESYAVLIGILVGAGIFKVTSDATAATGPSVLLGHAVLALAVLASAVPYLVFLTTPLGLEPGGEVLHIARTFGGARLGFLCGWLKLISYLGAAAYLADALAVNLLELARPGESHAAGVRLTVALLGMGFFLAVHVGGVRWFGRLQVGMCALLALSIVVLVVPGLFAVRLANFRPFFTGGLAGFGASLPALFFAYAGFEALAHSAGEVAGSRERLPRVFVRGILATTGIFVAMTFVAFGTLPAEALGASEVPMSAAAATYLPFGATALVTLGAVMAVATSLNATLFVPARLAFSMAHEGRLPPLFAWIHPRFGTPVAGLVVSFLVAAALLASGRLDLALGIAVVALVTLYGLHALALLCVPRTNPQLFAQVRTRIPRSVQRAGSGFAVLAMAGLLVLQLVGDVERIGAAPPWTRWRGLELTTTELFGLWVLLGLAVYSGMRSAADVNGADADGVGSDRDGVREGGGGA